MKILKILKTLRDILFKFDVRDIKNYFLVPIKHF